MKKLLILAALIPILLISCGIHKNLLRTAYNTPPSENEKYFGPTNSLSEKAALAMIGTFPKHKYRGFRHQKVDSAWTRVDIATMRDILNDKNAESVTLFLAAEINPDAPDTYLLPTVVIQIKLIETDASKGKGSYLQFAKTQYLSSPHICPPPRGECNTQ
jgi:hypothetical protein